MKRWTVSASLVCTGIVLGSFLTHSVLQGQKPPEALSREAGSLRTVVARVLPAVVSIEAVAKKRETKPTAEGQFRQGFGSGVLIDPRGVVLTNHHVVEGADEVIVQLKDGRKIVTKDVKSDPKTDLAIVRIAVKGDLPSLELGDSDAMEIGDQVVAVGAPFGLVGSVTHGIVSGKGRSLKMNMYEDFVQTDAAINPGNSGGPLIGMDGKVIGITTAIKSRSGGFQGVGLAISSNLARDILTKLQRDGVIKRGWLGVQVRELSEDGIGERLRLPKEQKGVYVSRLIADGPADKAGVKEGDVLVRIGGTDVTDGRELQKIVADLPLGKPVKLVVLRGGELKNLELVIEELP